MFELPSNLSRDFDNNSHIYREVEHHHVISISQFIADA